MHTFHVVIYKIIQFFVRIWFAVSGKYSFSGTDPKSSPDLILTNHNTNWDFLYFGTAFRKHMYFVASEHIFRSGFVSAVIKFLVSPIARKKGASSINTVREIKDRLSKGYNVCMMAEGNRSFTGETGFVSPATAKLVKSSGAGLSTFRLHGGYFVNPRWSRKTRKGPIWGEIVAHYDAKQLASMKTAEIYEIIKRDLFVDAYEDQDKFHYEYKTQAPAEDLETALFACPDCGSFGTLESTGDRLVCASCGSEHIFDREGYFSRPDGRPAAFRTTLDWGEWQNAALKEKIAAIGEHELIRKDGGAKLFLVHPLEGKICAAEGTVELYKDELRITDGDAVLKSFDIRSVSNMAVILVNTLLFSADDGYYELRLPNKASALHYLISYYYINGKEYKD